MTSLAAIWQKLQFKFVFDLSWNLYALTGEESRDQVLRIQSLISRAYRDSADFKMIVDDLLASGPDNFVRLQYKVGNPPVYVQTQIGINAILIDPDDSLLPDKSDFVRAYIGGDGKLHASSFDRILIHELVHAITSETPGATPLVDEDRFPLDPNSTNATGSTVALTNKVMASLFTGVRGRESDAVPRVGYDAVFEVHESKLLRDQTDGAMIDAAFSMASNAQGTVDLDNGAGQIVPFLQFDGGTYQGTVANGIWVLGRPLQNNKIDGTDANDHLLGGLENDIISGGSGNDRLLGNRGNDTLEGGAGNDTLFGEDGADVAVFSGQESDYQITFTKPEAGEVTVRNIASGETDTLHYVESLSFTAGTMRVLDFAAELPSPEEVRDAVDTILEELKGALSAFDAPNNVGALGSTANASIEAQSDTASAEIASLQTQIASVFDGLEGTTDPEQLASIVGSRLAGIDGISVSGMGSGGTGTAGSSSSDGIASRSFEFLDGIEDLTSPTQVAFTLAKRFDPIELSAALEADLGVPAANLSFDLLADLKVVFAYDVPILIDFSPPEGIFDVSLGEGRALANVEVFGNIGAPATPDGSNQTALDATLGFLEVSATELDVDENEQDIFFSLQGLYDAETGFDVIFEGEVDLDLSVASKEVGVDVGERTVPILPGVEADFLLALDYLSEGDATLEESVFADVKDVRINLDSLADLLRGVFEQFEGVTDTFPLEPIFELLNAPIPILDPLINDTVFDPDQDEAFDPDYTILDLLITAEQFDPRLSDAVKALSAFKQLFALYKAIEDIADNSKDGLTLSLGGGSLEDATLIAGDGSLALSDLQAALGALADLLSSLSGEEEEGDDGEGIVTNSVGAPLSDGAVTANGDEVEDDPFSAKFEVPLLESPEALLGGVIDLLFNPFTDEPTMLVQFTLPKLEFSAEADLATIPFAPLPLTAVISGLFGVATRFGVGYDTAAFDDGFNFGNGFFLFGALDPVTVDGVERQPLASLELGIGASANAVFALGEASVGGGLTGEVRTFLADANQDGKSRFNELAGCFVDLIDGSLTASLFGELSVGFGEFGFTERVEFGNFVLAQFDIPDPCPHAPAGIPELTDLPLGEGLARQNSSVLELHVGALASRRNLPFDRDDQGTLIPLTEESFIVSAVPSDEDDPAPTAEIAVQAFGVFQRFGQNQEIFLIDGAGGSDNDRLIISDGLNVAASLSGGAGNDQIVGGDGADTLRGDAGADLLSGGAGGDDLQGGAGADTLRGGAGGDTLDGGADSDLVTYTDSDAAIRIDFDPSFGVGRGFGGTAEGDVLIDIEQFRGSQFDDEIRGPELSASLFDGNAGNDLLVGGNLGDLFIGGDGADDMRGDGYGFDDALDDRVSYSLSRAAVDIDVRNGVARGGFAEGDTYTGIEYFQLTRGDDRFRGDFAANLVEAGRGDDSLRTSFGDDSLYGEEGNDTIDAAPDGNELDGGALRRLEALGVTQSDVTESDGADRRALEAINQDVLRTRDLLSFRESNEGVEVTLLSQSSSDRAGRAVGQLTGREDLLLPEVEVDFVGNDAGLRQKRDDNSFEDVLGSIFDDEITGDRTRNVLDGSLGNDRLNGNDNDDTLIGQLGDDFLRGDDGNDSLIGGAGDDNLRGGAGLDWADWSSELGSVNIDLSEQWVFRGVGDDYSGPAKDVDNASDEFLATLELANFQGASRAVISLQSGGTEFDYIRSVENLRGTDFADTLAGSSSANLIAPGAADFSSNENEIVNGNNGIDTIILERPATFGITATDIQLDEQGNGFAGTTLGDETAQTDISSIEQIRLIGGRGDDSVDTRIAGNDVLLLGQGDDFVQSRDGADIVRVGQGDDTVHRMDPDILSFPNRTLNASDFSEEGPFLLDGGAGIDALALDLSYETEDRTLLWDEPDQVSDTRIITKAGGAAVNFEILAGFVGGSGNDLIGQSGFVDNVIYGGAGNDTILPGFGFDLIDGGAGFDRVVIDYADAPEGASLLVQSLDGILFGELQSGGEAIGRFQIRNVEDEEINGTAGNDTFVGEGGSQEFAGRGGIDVYALRGGADRFVLATDGRNDYLGANEFAITDMDAAEGDVLVLAGDPSMYLVQIVRNTDTGNVEGQILFADPENGNAETLIATILNPSSFSLTSNVEYQLPPVEGVDVSSALIVEPVTSNDTVIVIGNQQGEVISDIEGGTDLGDLTSDIVFASLARSLQLPDGTFEAADVPVLASFSGVSEAIGRHRNIFEEGGLVVSTGNAEELASSNRDFGLAGDASGLSATTIDLDFEGIGSFTTTAGDRALIYRAEIPNEIGTLRSLTIVDPNTPIGGASGIDTGVDFAAITITDKFVGNASGFTQAAFASAVAPTDQDLQSTFEFTQDRIAYEAGSIRPNNIGLISPDLRNAPNGLIDFSEVDFAFSSAENWVSLGDGGQIGFDLATPVDLIGTGPRYVYIAEIGATEDLQATLQLSSSPLQTSRALSTDLGSPGRSDDDATLSFSFDLEAVAGAALPFGESTVTADLFEITLVSEELPERLQVTFDDIVQITVNGESASIVTDSGVLPFTDLAGLRGENLTPLFAPNTDSQSALTDVLGADVISRTFRVAAELFRVGENEIEIRVADGQDAFLDTAVFLSPIARRLDVGTTEGDVITAPADEALEIAGLGGDDSLTGSQLADVIRGGAGADDIEGGDADDSLSGGNGDDTLDGGDGDDNLAGGAGDDIATYDATAFLTGAVTRGDAGWEIDDGIGGVDTLLDVEQLLFRGAAETGSDIIVDLPSDLSLVLGDGTLEPNIAAVAQDDIITLTVSRQGSNVSVLSASDPINVLANDIDLDDTGPLSVALARLFGAAFRSPAEGEDFLLESDIGTLRLGRDGAAEFLPDLERLGTGAPGTVRAEFLYRAFDGETSGADGSIVVEVLLEGVPGLDVLGTAEGEELFGDLGDDTLDGLGGDDLLFGSGGNDIYIGGAGSDFLIDSNGDDLAIFEGARSEYRVTRNTDDTYNIVREDEFDFAVRIESFQFDDQVLDVSTATLPETMRVQGSGLDDDLSGSDDAEFFTGGGAGNDRVSAEGGDDLVRLGSGDDTVFGGSGNDVISAEAGDDVLVGEAGDDAIYGGDGNDLLVGDFSSVVSSAVDSVIGFGGDDVAAL